MKGTERPMLTIHPTMVETIRLGRSPFGAGHHQKDAKGIPMTYAKMVATHVMMSVSAVPCKNKLPYWAEKGGEIEHGLLHLQAALKETKLAGCLALRLSST